MHFALYGRPVGPDAEKRMSLLLSHLAEKKVRLSVFAPLAGSLSASGLRVPSESLFTSAEDLSPDVDIFLSLGGDGTFLWAF